MLTDTHCHLTSSKFDADRAEVIARAIEAGVTRMVTICTQLENEPQVRAIADAHAPVFYAAGVHPMSVAEHAPFTLDDLLTIADHPKMVGIGETGLDYHYTADSKAIQIESLRLHIEAARQTNLPLIIHSRDADDDMADILSAEFRAAPYTCVMHCFSSGSDLAATALGRVFSSGTPAFTAFFTAARRCWL